MWVILGYTLNTLYLTHSDLPAPHLHGRLVLLQSEYSLDIGQLTKRVGCILLDRLCQLPYGFKLYRRVDRYTRHHLGQVGGVSLYDCL